MKLVGNDLAQLDEDVLPPTRTPRTSVAERAIAEIDAEDAAKVRMAKLKKAAVRGGGALAAVGSVVQGSAIGAGGYQSAYGKTEEDRRAGTAEATGGLMSILGGTATAASAGFATSLATGNPLLIGGATIGAGILGGTAAHYGGSQMSQVIDERTGGAYTSQVGDMFAGRGADALSPTLMGLGDRFADVGQSDPNSMMGVASNYWGKKTEDWDVAGAMSSLTGLVGLGGGGPQAQAPSAAVTSMSDTSSYAALGMPDPFTGAAAPGGATPAPQPAKDWDAIVASKMAESQLYSSRQMETMGADGKDQFFGSATSRTSDWYTSEDKSGIKKKGKGPGTFIPTDVLAGDRDDQSLPSVDLNEYIQRMQDTRAANQVGASNNRQQQNIIAQNEHTQPISPAAATPDQRETAQRVESETRRSESEGGGEALASAIDSLNSKLDGLADIKIDTSEITTAIGTSTSEIVGALGSELSVSVTNPTFDVNVLSLPAGAATPDASAAGADVTQLATVVTALAGLQDLHKTEIAGHETRIAKAEADNVNQGTDIDTLKTDTQGLDAATITTSITTQVDEAKSTIQGEVNNSLDDIIGKVDNNATLLNEVKGTSDDTATTVGTFKDSIKAASDTAIEAKNTADAAKDSAKDTKVVADNAVIVANNALTEATAATKKANDLKQVVNDNRQGIESEVRTVAGVVATNKTVGTDNATAIRKLAQTCNVIDSKAGTALANTQRTP
jgi:hypothetical protein